MSRDDRWIDCLIDVRIDFLRELSSLPQDVALNDFDNGLYVCELSRVHTHTHTHTHTL
jgi:hypothetical protein